MTMSGCMSRAAREPMPFYFRNADGDELLFVHRGEGMIETDFGPLDVRKGRLHQHPARRHLSRRARDPRQFLPDHSIARPNSISRRKACSGQHALYDPAVITTPEPAPQPRRQPANGKCASKWTTRSRRSSIRSIRSTWSAGRATSPSGRSTCATSGPS